MAVESKALASMMRRCATRTEGFLTFEGGVSCCQELNNGRFAMSDAQEFRDGGVRARFAAIGIISASILTGKDEVGVSEAFRPSRTRWSSRFPSLQGRSACSGLASEPDDIS